MTREDLDRLERLTADTPLTMTRAEMDELLALARESLDARELYRVEELDDARAPHERTGEWDVLVGEHSLEWCRGYIDAEADDGYTRRIVRERDGEVVT